MNKRARLARRVLREHRAGFNLHFQWSPWGDQGSKSLSIWTCPHCITEGTNLTIRPERFPRAYR